MKIRIKGNSVRIRLTRSEVEKFGKEGYLEESTSFINGTLKYALQISQDTDELSADMLNNNITMYVPAAMGDKWTNTNEVGYSNTIATPGGNLFLLLEKDFKCTDANVLEDQSDNYEHPNLTC